MADDAVILQCDKCGAKLKVRQVALKVMREIKCAKCGNKIPTREASTTPAPSAPASEEAPAPAPDKPVVVETPPASPPVAPPASPDQVAELARDLSAAQARVAELEGQVKAAASGSDEMDKLKRRIAELESAAAGARGPGAELAEARRTIHEQEQRLTELQALWYQKEKETRAAQAAATRANQEREKVLGQIKAVLKSYHEAEVQAATERIASLEARIGEYLSGPPASE